jgi:D-3-phosphoglycerate dehydrogenase
MPRVVVTDYTFPTLEIEEEILKPLGCDVVAGQCKTSAALIPHVAQADVVLTQFAPIKADVIAAMRQARAIIRYGIGVDNVDLEAARAHGIPVCNVPDYCTDEVADHTLAFILGLTRQVVPNCIHVRSGQWGLSVLLPEMKTLRDLTVGIVGFGRIGREVAARLAHFKCRRMAHDPEVKNELIMQAGCEPVSFTELIHSADIITLHCPLAPPTARLLGPEEFAKMKNDSFLINVARGGLVDTGALIAALQSGKLAGAALDVCDPEPIPADSPLRALTNVILSSHVASASERAVRACRETAANLASQALAGQPLKNVVNGVAGARKFPGS